MRRSRELVWHRFIIDLSRKCLQISFLISSEFKRLNKFLTLPDRASYPDYVDSPSSNVFPNFYGIFQIIDLHASVKSKLIDTSFKLSTNLGMIMFSNPKKKLVH